MYPVFELCQYIIEYCNFRLLHIDLLKLLRLLYLINETYTANRGKPCFRERIVMADYGPTIQVVYKRFLAYGSANIPLAKYYQLPRFVQSDKALIEFVLGQYACCNNAELLEIIEKSS
jgi:uncharacterized phage-associated protein